jgi:glycosyltransferase involved in cell wall biosynthesis
MRIFCLCVVKNESDILEETISAAAQWADGIFLSDHESTDETPQIIQSLCVKFPNVFNAGPVQGPFSDAIRGRVFQRNRGVSARGDWWCRLDADEFYIDDPHEFIQQLDPHIDMVWSSSYQFYLTDRDVQAYEQDPVAFVRRPVRDRLRYYKNNWSELRFVKHTFPFWWRKEWPAFRCSASPQRIRLAHFQYRSPPQILTRLAIRRDIAVRTKGGIFTHEIQPLAENKTRVLEGIDEGNSAIPREVYWDRVVNAEDLDFLDQKGLIGRETELREIRGIWNRKVPFFLWKLNTIIRMTLNPKKLIPYGFIRSARARLRST